MSLVREQSHISWPKNRMHLPLRTENECARLFSILFSSSLEYIVAWSILDVSFPTTLQWAVHLTKLWEACFCEPLMKVHSNRGLHDMEGLRYETVPSQSEEHHGNRICADPVYLSLQSTLDMGLESIWDNWAS